ncbi:TPA: EAL domain-containing protein [Klebsiella aerogenes]|nr:EAL domain-containing protein [Klebsiella aerogenes]HCR0222228.1 EAL domain-containing protein [Klebsiella aerogenes]
MFVKRKDLESIVTGILILAVCLPTGFSIWFAHKQSENKFIEDVEGYTSSIISRTENIVRHSEEALGKSNDWHGGICNQEHQSFMKQVAFTHQYIKEVLWVKDRVPLCSSMEIKSKSVSFPAPMRITKGGDYGWYTSTNDLDIAHKMVALGKGNSIVMIDPDDFVDVARQSNTPIDVALIGLVKDTIFSSSKPLDLAIWKKIKHEKNSTIVLDNVIYNVQYFPGLNLAVVGWSSSLPLDKAWYKNLMTMIPAGLFISVFLSLVIFRILRRLQSPYYTLLDAIDSHSITVNYQPIVCLQTQKVVGAEALARWRLEDGGYLSPDIFIPLAEQTGLIQKLTELILLTIFKDLGKWLSMHPDLHISLNLSADNLTSERLSDLLDKQMLKWNIRPEQIALELTERQFTDPELSGTILSKYRSKGHAVYIDDFGTGYSSLSYLQKLPVDVLKIDKSFINSWESMQITPHIIEIAHSLHLQMVSEGIETEKQRQWLIEHGVQFGQGWLFSKALPKTEFILWSENNLKN